MRFVLIFLFWLPSFVFADVKQLICSGTQTYSYDEAKTYGFKTKTAQRAIVYEFMFDEEKDSFSMRGHPRLKGKEGEWVSATKLEITDSQIAGTFALSLGKNFKIGNLMKRNTGIATRYSGKLDRFTGKWVSGNTILDCTVRENRKF